MGERFLCARERRTTSGEPYWALCGARLRPGTRVDIKLPDGLIIRDLTLYETPMRIPFVYARLHGISMRIAVDRIGLRRSPKRKRKKAK